MEFSANWAFEQSTFRSPRQINFVFIARSLDFSDRAGVKDSQKTASDTKGVNINAEAVEDNIESDNVTKDAEKFDTSSQRLWASILTHVSDSEDLNRT